MSRLNQWFTLILFATFCWQGFAQAPRIVINPLGHSAKINNLLFTPDGNRIISVSEDKTIRVWNPDNGEMTKKFESQVGDGSEGVLYASSISPDGKLLAVAGYPVSSEKENYIVIIDLEKGQQVATAVGHSEIITSLCFNKKGNYLASGSADRTVKIWKMDGTKLLNAITTLTIPSAVASLSFNSATNELAVAHESTDILVFPMGGLDNGTTKFLPKVLKHHKGVLNKLSYSPDGAYLASSSLMNELCLWEVKMVKDKPESKVLLDFKSTPDPKEKDRKDKDMIVSPINAIAFSQDSKILVGLDVEGKGYSWSIPSGTLFTNYTGHDNTVFSAAFAPSTTGNYVVASAGGMNNEILLWNPINSLTVRRIKGKGSAIQDLAFGDGLELFICRDLATNGKPQFKSSFNFASFSVNRNPGQVNLASQALNKEVVQTGVNTLELPKGKVIEIDASDRILDYQVLQDGSVLVASDFALKLFDKNGFLSKEFVGHYGAVRAVAVSADGKYLASGGEDQSIILWKMAETGYAPSLRKVFEGDDWEEFFSSLPIDSLTKEPTKKAWRDVMDFLKKNGNKAYKDIEAAYKSLGEVVIPFATLFATEDYEWVCWTPRGYFSCSSSGSQYFGWHVNRGINQLADFYAAEQYFEILYRPKEMTKSIVQGKRVEEIIRESGERIFDLSKLHRPCAGFFDMQATVQSTGLLKYDKGRFFTQARTIPLTVEVYDGGGGIKEIDIYQNDKLIIADTSVRSRGEGQRIMKTYAVEMMNETNEFRLKVVNYQMIESKPDILPIEYTGEAIATSSLHILAVGINKYQNAAYNLNYARSDAEAFVEKVQQHGKSIFKSVNIVPVYDEDATKDHIVTGFKSIINRAKPEDVFVFYYAGHGTLDEEKNDEYYLVPTDVTKLYGDAAQLTAKGISATELKGFLTQLKSQKQIILLDACHSGGALKSMNVRGAAADERAIVQLARSSGVVMIASSGSKQFATEFDQLRHGVFTYALLEALDGKGDNGDKKITVNEIKLYMEERVPDLTKEYGGQAQYPTGYITGNDFPISILNR